MPTCRLYVRMLETPYGLLKRTEGLTLSFPLSLEAEVVSAAKGSGGGDADAQRVAVVAPLATSLAAGGEVPSDQLLLMVCSAPLSLRRDREIGLESIEM